MEHQTAVQAPDQAQANWAQMHQAQLQAQQNGQAPSLQSFPMMTAPMSGQGQQPMLLQPGMVLSGKPLAVATSHLGPGVFYPAGIMTRPAMPGQPVMMTAGQIPAGGYPQLQGANPMMQSMYAARPTGTAPTMAYALPMMTAPAFVQTAPAIVPIKQGDSNEDRPSSSHSANTSAGALGSEGDGSPLVGGLNKSRYRGVSYDRKKTKWRVQIKVAALGKSGVSVGYFDTEEAAARAYDRAAIGLLGRDNPNLQTNFDLEDYAGESIPRLTGKTREEVKTTLKSERIKQAPRRRFTSRQRTSRFMGVGSSNRKNQWQARILVHGKVTHLGYYETEEEAARVYDRVSLALHGEHAQTNFPSSNYSDEELQPFRGLDREDLQRALGVKPMDKSSQYRGVSKKKGKWEAKVMVNRRWAYRELFDSEEEAARAYDRALWRLKPREARSYVNFKDEVPPGLEFEAAAPTGGAMRGGGHAGRDSDDDCGGLDDGGSGDDFQYEYRPTKGTRRSASMRAKRAGSAPNLQALQAQQQKQEEEDEEEEHEEALQLQHHHLHNFIKTEEEELAEGGLVFNGSAFVPLSAAGGSYTAGSDPSMAGLQNGMSGSNQNLTGMLPTGSDDQLLVRVGSETHFLPASSSILGKRTGMQRIQSEPHFAVSRNSPEAMLNAMPGPSANDIHDLMNDRDLFRDLMDVGQQPDLALELLSPRADQPGKEHNLDGLSSIFFEDEEAALANVEFSRPRKMTKSMSMSQLSSLVNNAEGIAPLDATADQSQPGSSSPDTEGSGGNKLGPLGQPIRRINTFTTSLATFEEGEELVNGVNGSNSHQDLAGNVLSPRLAKLHMMGSSHSSDEDLFKRLMDPSNIPVDGNSMEDAMRMLGSDLDTQIG